MNKYDVVEQFWQSRGKIDNPRLATQFKLDKSLYYDLSLVKKYLPEGARVLDLGCGTCTLANELIPYVSYIRGIDKQPGLLRFCQVSNKLETKIGDISTYKDNNTYDVILIIGVINYIIEDQVVEQIYKNCYAMLAPGGHLIVKHQSGILEDVVINKFSEELESNYFALYRHQKKDIDLLIKQGFLVEQIDIYPSHMNNWKNTHHYAYVSKKRRNNRLIGGKYNGK